MTVSRQSITRAVRRLAAASLATLALASDAQAQRHLAPAGVSTVATPPATFTAGSRAAVQVVDDRGDRVFDHTVNGALIGAGAGLAYAFILSANADNHGEGLPVFVVLPPVGAVLGAVVGTVVGLVRTQ
jgi:hypothetical protein